MPTSQSPEDIMGKWFEDSDNRRWTAFVNELNSTQASTLQKLLASKTNTALPKDVPKAAPPKDVPKAASPKDVPKVALPKDVPKAAPPKDVPKAAPPKDVPKAALPKEVPKAAPPKDVPKAAPPKDVPKAALPKDVPKAALPKDVPKAALPKDVPKAAPPKDVPKAAPPKAAPHKDTPPKGTSKEKVAVATHMSPDNLSFDICNQEHCRKGAGYKAAMKLKRKLFDNESNSSTITDGGNKEENITTPIKSSTMTDGGNKENTLITPVKTGDNHHDKRKKGEDTVTLELGAIDWSAVSTESAGQYTVMFGGKPVKITVETEGSDGEVSNDPVETSSRKDNDIETDQFKDKTTEEDDLDLTKDSLVEKGIQRMIELNNVLTGEDISVSDTEEAETEGNSKNEDGSITDGQGCQKDSGVECDGTLTEQHGDDDKKNDENSENDTLTSTNTSEDDAEQENLPVKSEKVDGAYLQKVTV